MRVGIYQRFAPKRFLAVHRLEHAAVAKGATFETFDT